MAPIGTTKCNNSLSITQTSLSCATGLKRVELEDRSEEKKKKKKKKKKVAKPSVLSSVMEISGGGDDSVFPAKISVKKRRKVVDEKAEGIATASSNPFLFVSGELTCLHVFFFLLKFYALFGFQES
nr:hypothetical protein CFP56_70354 [Quercus suber]